MLQFTPTQVQKSLVLRHKDGYGHIFHSAFDRDDIDANERLAMGEPLGDAVNTAVSYEYFLINSDIEQLNAAEFTEEKMCEIVQQNLENAAEYSIEIREEELPVLKTLELLSANLERRASAVFDGQQTKHFIYDASLDAEVLQKELNYKAYLAIAQENSQALQLGDVFAVTERQNLTQQLASCANPGDVLYTYKHLGVDISNIETTQHESSEALHQSRPPFNSGALGAPTPVIFDAENEIPFYKTDSNYGEDGEFSQEFYRIPKAKEQAFFARLQELYPHLDWDSIPSDRAAFLSFQGQDGLTRMEILEQFFTEKLDASPEQWENPYLPGVEEMLDEHYRKNLLHVCLKTTKHDDWYDTYGRDLIDDTSLLFVALFNPNEQLKKVLASFDIDLEQVLSTSFGAKLKEITQDLDITAQKAEEIPENIRWSKSFRITLAKAADIARDLGKQSIKPEHVAYAMLRHDRSPTEFKGYELAYLQQEEFKAKLQELSQ